MKKTGNMRYKKGESGNPSGRPRGKGNRTTEEIRKLLQTFIEGKIPELEKIWKQLEPKDKISFIDRLLRHTIPAPLHSIEQFSEEDLDLLIEKLRQKHAKLN
jgi:hypothetical protein